MAKKKKQPSHDTVESFEHALTKTEQFIEDNQKSISIALGVIICIVLVYLGYKKLYLAPQQEEAASQMFVAEQYFRNDSFNLALYGDGNYLGFIDIIEDYGITKPGNLAKYYAGISYLHLGDYEEAIKYLKKFDAETEIIGPVAIGAIGDAYLEMGNPQKALSYYQKAYEKEENMLTTPLYLYKSALIHEENGEYQKALDNYLTIRKEYPKSHQGRRIDKYIANVKVVIGKE